MAGTANDTQSGTDAAARKTDSPQRMIDHGFADMLSMFRAAVADRRDQPAVLYFDSVLTYGDLDRYSDRLASWLMARGVGRGDRVSVILQNMPQFLMMLVAAWKVGAIPVPGNPMYRRGELARIFQDCTPRAVLCLAGNLEETREALVLAGLSPAILTTSALSFQARNDHRVLPVSGQTEPAGEWLEAVVAASDVPALPAVETGGDAPSLILYTSGTTGQPKGAVITHRNLAFNGCAMRDIGGLHDESRILGIAPFFHITGMTCHIAAAFAARAALVLHYRVEPSVLLDTIREHRPTFVVGAITAFNALMNVPGITAEDMRSFDRIYSGGAPIPPALHAELESRLCIKIHSCYGMTETTAQTHMAPHNADIPVDPASGALSIGKLTPFTSAKIVGDDGRELGPGAAGELLVRGPQIMAGYWQKPDDTAAALADGWMHTGDVAFRDVDGWFYLVDRIKDVIIASGFKVWPREVEDVLYEHEAVREAAVIGVPDSYRGETVKAYVSLKPGTTIDADALAQHCRTRLAAYKVPRSVEILDELPKTVTGKIQRVALRAPVLRR